MACPSLNQHSSLSTTRNSTAVLSIVVASYLMIVVDISIVITGLPKMRDSLGISAAALSWVHNSYTLAFGGLLLLGARAGDVFGRRLMLQVGLALFTVASLAIAVAPSTEWLLGARAVQGAGAAVLAPSTLALLSTNFEVGPARTRALSYYAAAAGVGATVGLVLGGLFADLISWRAGFLINLPLGLLLILASRRYLSETARTNGKLDSAAAVSSTFGMVALVYGIVHAAEVGWSHSTVLAPLLIGALLTAGFLAHQAQSERPILPLSLFADRERSAAYVARMLFLGGMVGFWFFTTQFLQGVLGLRPLMAGLAFLPATLSNLAAALLVPWLMLRLGPARLIPLGIGLGVAGLAWLGQAHADSSYWTGVALPMLVIGAAQGLTLAPLTSVAVAGVSPQDAGAASGMVNVAHQLGGSIGLAMLVVVFASVDSGSASAVTALAKRVAAAIDTGAAMLAVALPLVLLTLRSSPTPRVRNEA